MINEILPNLYRIEVPIPNNPLKALNSYVIKDSKRNLIIDTGMNREECSTVMFAALEELKVELENTDLFITHMHADHSGLITTLARPNSKVFCSRADADVIVVSEAYWAGVLNGACAFGFPAKRIEFSLDKHPGYKYAPIDPIDFSIVSDGDTISVGDYHFRCVATPGHTQGHMCLYEPYKRILVSGDHILGDITPNISLFMTHEGNPLEDYMQSLAKVYQLEVDLVLPGHRKALTNHRERITELKEHYLQRAAEILTILEMGSMDAYGVASYMKWDIDSPTWELFPAPQKWFATGEAIAHLRYLEAEDKVKRETVDEIYVFSLN